MYLLTKNEIFVPQYTILCNIKQHIETSRNKKKHYAPMSSNIRIPKICEFCNNAFIAKTTTTRYCSDNCSKKAYKARKREEKINNAFEVEKEKNSEPLINLKHKEFLTIDEVCTLLSVSRWTIWRAIKNNTLKASKIGRRIIIKKSDIENL